uniref:Glycoside hydrolase family protein 48 n=1 Tax=Leptinotarsa decemlineata TaxID=7539 RepID=E7CIZ2_LEPDE|nr:glycoside hydrolase family protein 48 [Leptinotarsa decemlineata]
MKLLSIALALAGLTLVNCAGVYKQRFLEQYNKIHNENNGYFSKEGVPYHAVETLIIEACDHGHQTTSEAYSYYIWLEAMNGAISGNFSSFNVAWKNMEDYIIPSHTSQPNTDLYNPKNPATYAPAMDTPEQWPTSLEPGVPVGEDPLFQELQTTYDTYDVYALHWLLDVDNTYGFGDSQGTCSGGPSVKKPSFINNYGRGPSENVWMAIPSGICEAFKYGSKTGFSGIYSKGNPVPNWKFSVAPDADARAILGAFWASRWATEKGELSQITDTLAKASKLGDYLRYAMFEKYFKRVGNCIDPYKCPGGHDRESAHYLLSWHVGWGGSVSRNGGYAWRVADATVHFGYQNPLAAYALSQEPTLKPKSPTAAQDWAASLERQLEFYEYVQSAEGAFGGGVVNSWKDRYDTPPDDIASSTFHGMFYDWQPGGHNPPSTRWFGMQPWSTDRLAQYYYVTGDKKAKAILDKWVSWVISEITFEGDNYKLPNSLEWSGVPPNVHVKVADYGSGIGPAAATARTLSYYAAKSGNKAAKQVAKKLLDGMWKLYRTNLGVSSEEQPDYDHFQDKVYVPPGWSGVYPNGDVLNSSSTFLSIRSFYKKDPQWHKIEARLNGGPAPTFTYHRFWDQSEVALAMGAYGLLFNE